MHPEERILKAYHDRRERRLYFNELKRLTGLGDSSLARTLKKLTQQGLLKKDEGKALTHYALTRAPAHFIIFDQERFEGLAPDVRQPLQAFLQKAPSQLHSILLFGSAAREEQREESDLDLLIIIHHHPDEELQRRYAHSISASLHQAKRYANAQSAHPLSLFIITTKDLDEPDALTRQALETGFPIKGHQRYYEEVRP